MYFGSGTLTSLEKAILWLAVFASIGGVVLAGLGIYLLAKLISFLP